MNLYILFYLLVIIIKTMNKFEKVQRKMTDLVLFPYSMSQYSFGTQRPVRVSLTKSPLHLQHLLRPRRFFLRRRVRPRLIPGKPAEGIASGKSHCFSRRQKLLLSPTGHRRPFLNGVWPKVGLTGSSTGSSGSGSTGSSSSPVKGVGCHGLFSTLTKVQSQ